MGSDKSRLMIGDQTFLERVVEAASQAFEEVVIVGRGAVSRKDTRTITDDPNTPNAAISGVLAALLDAQKDDRAWILAVDYPLIATELLTYLRRRFERSTCELLVPVIGGEPQMVCAGYATSLVSKLQTLIGSGDYRLRSLLDDTSTESVYEDELRSFDLQTLSNVNDPQQYQQVVSHYGQNG